MSETSCRTKHHIRVVPATRSGCRDDEVLMSNCPVQDGFDGTPRVVHVIEITPVVTSLTDGCVVRLEAQE